MLFWRYMRVCLWSVWLMKYTILVYEYFIIPPCLRSMPCIFIWRPHTVDKTRRTIWDTRTLIAWFKILCTAIIVSKRRRLKLPYTPLVGYHPVVFGVPLILSNASSSGSPCYGRLGFHTCRMREARILIPALHMECYRDCDHLAQRHHCSLVHSTTYTLRP